MSAIAKAYGWYIAGVLSVTLALWLYSRRWLAELDVDDAGEGGQA